MTPLGSRIVSLILSGDVHRARLEARGSRLTGADRRAIALACRKWGADPRGF